MMTTSQQAALKAAVLADQSLAGLATLISTGQDQTAADALNSPVPAFIVWRTNVSDAEIMRNGFDWTRVDNLSVGKARIWDWMFRFGSIDASKPNIRAGINATWVGTAADLAVRAAVYVHCKRPATLAEKLLSTGTGSDASPATLTFDGTVTSDDIGGMR